MLSLLRIRMKYLIRKPCILFWAYLFIPIIILIVGVIFLSFKEKAPLLKYQFNPIPEQKEFFVNNDPYIYIKKNLPFAGFLVPDKENCNIIKNILTEHGLCNITSCPICTNKESDFNNNTQNIIEIVKKDGKYKVDLTIERNYYDIYPEIFFSKSDLEQDKTVDPFYALEIKRKNGTLPIPKKVHTFFELESLLARIIIRLEGKEKQNHNFEMSFGYNKYPDSYQFANSEQLLGIPLGIMFVFVLQFSLVNYNINMRMIDEKEAKLDIFLERQGISHFKYILSWLFTYMILYLTSIISFSVLAAQQANGHEYLLIIDLILFTLSLFSVCLLFTTCFKTIKNGSTAIKFYNFGSIFLGFAIVLPKTSKVTKIIFAFIPQINFFMNYWSTISLGNFDVISNDIVLLRAAKMSYIETMIMYFVEIIFYLSLSCFIYSYKHSGLPFCSYMKSCFTKVTRNIGNVDILEDNKLNDETFEKHFQELSETNKEKLESNQCLKLVNVSKNFDDLKAVNHFNGELFPDEIYCLLGHNGAGKTTTINMISGIYDPDEGDIITTRW